jgi:O-antigen/teichoic acid export membrane protein
MGDAIGFGIPMVPHIVAGTSISYVDRLIVSSRLGSESLGIYMVAMQVGMGMMAIIEPLNKALAPWLFSQLSKGHEDLRRTIVKRTYQLFAALILAGMALWLVSWWLFHLFIAPEFGDAKFLIPWMIGGFAFQGMYYGVVNYMFYAERTGLLSMVTGTTALCGGLLSYALVSTIGIEGAGASFMLNNLILFLLVWLVASRTVKMPWRAWR